MFEGNLNNFFLPSLNPKFQIDKAHRGHETVTGHNGTAKGRKCLRMDRAAQQHKGVCEGDCV